MTDPLLTGLLAVAVPMWVDRLSALPLSAVEERARDCGQVLANTGDVVLYKGRKGENAEAFNRLAEGIAAAALASGRPVEFLGARFEARHPERDGWKPR